MDFNSTGNDVLQLLVQIASQNPELLKTTEERLKKYETVPGFYSMLMMIVSNHTLDVNVRWQAVIYFKNGVDRYWRRKVPGAMSEDEKTNLKQSLIGIFNEPINQIATQIAVLIAKVARLDWPLQWPELVPSLLTAVQSPDEIVQHRSLLILNHVSKALASKRLAGDRRQFQELCASIFTFTLNVWKTHAESFHQMAMRGETGLHTALQKSLLSLKIIHKLIIHGFKDPHKVADVVLFLHGTFDKMATMLHLRQKYSADNQLQEMFEKYIVLLTKILLGTLDHHPFSFLQLIQPTLQFTVTFAIDSNNEGLCFEKFSVQCLNLIKGIVLCLEYRPAKSIEDTKEPATLEAHRIKTEFFTPEILVAICRRLVYHYFLLTEDDLNFWNDDPEGFAIEEKGEAWRYNLRVCTEVLFVAMFHEFRETLSPVLLEMMRNNEHVPDSPCLKDLLNRDAVYNAVGQAAFDLYDEVDFDNWFLTSLLTEMRRSDPCYKIVRRRVTWMVGQWVAVKLASDLRPTLYESILPLLAAEEDMVVRLTAAMTLKISVDDFEFNIEQFLPFLEPSFGLLFQLLKQVSGSDTKMHVLHVLSFVVDRVGSAIRPHAPALVHYLPLLWEESGEHNMLRCAILTTLLHLVEGLGTMSEQIYSFLIPVVRLSTDVTQDPHVYLLDDGLALWHATLENASTMNSNMFQLLPNILPLLETSTENLKISFQIIQAYLLLSPEDLKMSFVPGIVQTCNSLVKEFRAEGIILIMRFLELVLKVFPADGARLCQPVLPFVFQTVIEGQEYPMVMSMYLSVVARTILTDQKCAMDVISGLAVQHQETPEHLLELLLDVWVDKLPLVTQLERKKVLGLALTSLLLSLSDLITNRFCGLLLGVVEVLHDISKTEDTNSFTDSLLMTESDIEFEENEKEHSRRKKQLALKDPVHTVDLRLYLGSQLSQLRRNIGDVAFDDLMQTVDVETKQQLNEFFPTGTNFSE